MDKKMAFVGLGKMGKPMAGHCLRAHPGLGVYDLDKSNTEELESLGAKRLQNLAQVSSYDVIITMLPGPQSVRAVYTEIFAHCGEHRPLCVDCSTIDMATECDLHKKAQALGIDFGDAPVSGGVAAAQKAALAFMVGGSVAYVEAVRPWLEPMAKNVFHAGRIGCGQAAKLANNMLLGISMIGTCEAMLMARELGVDEERFYQIVTQSSGQNWSLSTYCPLPGPVPESPANRDYQPGFTAAMMRKDLLLAQDAAREAGMATPLGALATQLYVLMATAGMEEKDFSAMARLLAKKKQ